MTKVKEEKRKLPEYESYLSFEDIREITNRMVQSKTEIEYPDGAVMRNNTISQYDIALFTLEKGLKKLGDTVITKDNFESELRKQLDMSDIVLLYYDMWTRETKKK